MPTCDAARPFPACQPTLLLGALAVTAALAPAASAVIVLDDFTQTSDASLYPATEQTSSQVSPAQFVDVFGDDGELGRVVAFAPILSVEQVLSQTFDGSQTVSLDTSAGRLTSTSVGDGAPLLLLAYAALGPQAEEGQTLDLDVSAQEGVFLRYETNADVLATLRLVNLEGGIGTETAGNELTFTLDADETSLFLPFAAIAGEIVTRDFSTFPAVNTTLASLDRSSLDSLSLAFNPFEGPGVPEGLIFSFDSISFVPEPASAGLLAAGSIGLLGRRRRSVRQG